MTVKEQIIELFKTNVKGKTPDVTGKNERHDGKKGHWLEQQFGVEANGDNAPDFMGYELKNQTSSGKTTFGDWSANEYIFNNETFQSVFNSRVTIERRDKFMSIFGKPNASKGGRCSWSGEPCPTIAGYNSFGQRLVIVGNNDILAEYSFSKDMRLNKQIIVPTLLQQENLILARWYGNSTPENKTGKCLKDKVEDKFNDKGWFTCKMNSFGVYDEICFGSPMSFEKWIGLVKKGIVYFDSGMHQQNPRPYSEWRANNDFWDSLIYERLK